MSANTSAPPRHRQGLALSLLVALCGHAALLAFAWSTSALWPAAPATPVMVTKLVRLGPKQDQALLPEKRAASPAPPAPAVDPPGQRPPASQAAPPAAEGAPARVLPQRPAPRAGHRAHATRAALERVKARNHGNPSGAPEGDADEAELGEAYAAELYRCIKRHYVIEGIEAARIAGLSAVVLVHVQGDGRIVRHRVTTSSQVAAFDRAVSRAVQRCGRISPPPAALAAGLRREGLEVQFVP